MATNYEKTLSTIKLQIENPAGWKHEINECLWCYQWHKIWGIFCPGFYAIEAGMDTSGSITKQQVDAVVASMVRDNAFSEIHSNILWRKKMARHLTKEYLDEEGYKRLGAAISEE